MPPFIKHSIISSWLFTLYQQNLMLVATGCQVSVGNFFSKAAIEDLDLNTVSTRRDSKSKVKASWIQTLGLLITVHKKEEWEKNINLHQNWVGFLYYTRSRGNSSSQLSSAFWRGKWSRVLGRGHTIFRFFFFVHFFWQGPLETCGSSWQPLQGISWLKSLK